MNEIGAHERECALRYKAIEEATIATGKVIEGTNKAVAEVRNWLIGTFITVLMLVITMLGFMTVRYFDAVTKAPVQSVQVQTTVK